MKHKVYEFFDKNWEKDKNNNEDETRHCAACCCCSEISKKHFANLTCVSFSAVMFNELEPRNIYILRDAVHAECAGKCKS